MADLDLDAIEALTTNTPASVWPQRHGLPSVATRMSILALVAELREARRFRVELNAEREAHAATLLDLYHARAEAAEAERDARPAITVDGAANYARAIEVLRHDLGLQFEYRCSILSAKSARAKETAETRGTIAVIRAMQEAEGYRLLAQATEAPDADR